MKNGINFSAAIVLEKCQFPVFNEKQQQEARMLKKVQYWSAVFYFSMKLIPWLRRFIWKSLIYNSKELVSWIEINLILSKLVGRMLALDSNCKVYINKNVCTALLSVVILDLSTTRLIKMYSYLCCCFHRENNLEYKGSGMTVSRIQSMCKKAREVAEAVRS